MKHLFSLGVLCLLLALAIPAYGDIAKPKEKPSPSPELPKFVLHTRLVVVPDTKAWEAKLQISQSSLQELRAALNNGNETTAQSITRSSTRTIMAGVFMFLSLSFAGVWLARSVQARGQKAVAALLFGMAVIGATAMLAQANAGPPGSYYWKKLPQNLTKGAPTSGGLDIEIVADGEIGSSGMQLVLPIKPN
ncbi:MAG TPA: hypothetical protein VKC61_15825 [Pyrinomonadaceae bacterium]|nr:hypothetical protein [Pyrinomonadaceae bacterium]